MSAAEQWAIRYIQQYGLALVPIPPRHKAPLHQGWNQEGGYVMDAGEARQRWRDLPDHGIGAVLGPSGLCSIDVDAPDHAEPVLGALGIDLGALREATPTIQGDPTRYRLMFKAPPGAALGRKALTWPARQPGEKPLTLFELRAGDIQGVLPPTIHPGTGKPYVWLNPPNSAFPSLPKDLLELWQQWDSYRKELEAMCPWATQTFRPELPPRGNGARPNVIAEFNRVHSVQDLLKEHDYTQKGKRWLSPTSSSKLAGVTVPMAAGCSRTTGVIRLQMAMPMMRSTCSGSWIMGEMRGPRSRTLLRPWAWASQRARGRRLGMCPDQATAQRQRGPAAVRNARNRSRSTARPRSPNPTR
jgi:putative DNA primase/helicase